MIGRPWQKWRTSEIHYDTVSIVARCLLRRQYRGIIYLLLNVVKGIWGVDGEADQDDVRIWVRERAETIVILLTSGIPQGQLDVLSINLDIGDIVLEDGWDIDLCDLVLVTVQQLADSSCVWLSALVVGRVIDICAVRDLALQPWGSRRKQRRLTSGKVPLENTLGKTLAS